MEFVFCIMYCTFLRWVNLRKVITDLRSMQVGGYIWRKREKELKFAWQVWVGYCAEDVWSCTVHHRTPDSDECTATDNISQMLYFWIWIKISSWLEGTGSTPSLYRFLRSHVSVHTHIIQNTIILLGGCNTSLYVSKAHCAQHQSTHFVGWTRAEILFFDAC